jgi:oligoribonuclease NrnB/cAMP/cGMP phosphodiesterase (DHH superfamily)
MRLVTRGDFDGIACAVLVTATEKIEELAFLEPEEVHEKPDKVFPGDVLANLPYHANCSLWFDHHISNVPRKAFKGGFRIAPSAARVVYEYYGKDRLGRYAALVKEADKIDSASLSADEVKAPKGSLLLSLTLNPGRKEDEPYWNMLIETLRSRPLEETLALKDVRARCQAVLKHMEQFKETLKRYSTVRDNVIVLDTRSDPDFHYLNRYLIFTLFPEANILVKVSSSPRNQNWYNVNVAKSLFNRSSPLNVGQFLTRFGGGGHEGVGGCRVRKGLIDDALKETIEAAWEKGTG